MHKRSKQVETKFHFIWGNTEDGTISIHYVAVDKIAADIFTKSLPVSKVETFRTVLMGTDSTQSAQVWMGVLEYRSTYSLELERKFHLPDYKEKSKLMLITEFIYLNRQGMVLRIKIRFKLVNLDN